MLMFDEKGNTVRKASKSTKCDNEPSNVFIDRLVEVLNTKEVETATGEVITNMDAIIDSLIGKAIDGDIQICRLIRDLLNNR